MSQRGKGAASTAHTRVETDTYQHLNMNIMTSDDTVGSLYVAHHLSLPSFSSWVQPAHLPKAQPGGPPTERKNSQYYRDFPVISGSNDTTTAVVKLAESTRNHTSFYAEHPSDRRNDIVLQIIDLASMLMAFVLDCRLQSLD